MFEYVKIQSLQKVQGHRTAQGHRAGVEMDVTPPTGGPVGHPPPIPLRSARTHRLVVTRTKTSYGDHSFSVHGPSVWNSLPNDLRSTDMSIETFRARQAENFSLWTLTTAHLLLSANLGYTNGIIIIINPATPCDRSAVRVKLREPLARLVD